MVFIMWLFWNNKDYCFKDLFPYYEFSLYEYRWVLVVFILNWVWTCQLTSEHPGIESSWTGLSWAVIQSVDNSRQFVILSHFHYLLTPVISLCLHPAAMTITSCITLLTICGTDLCICYYLFLSDPHRPPYKSTQFVGTASIHSYLRLISDVLIQLFVY